ncbi:hypothetical protein [Fuerstiella marisgermanici]|uniref:Uncharacterized protein n=1 Tax=Fuerstiella marisgermanici TaxID=1891926 RepID=A0A1P8WKF6_9PLAN|nr:hypothetical protein [Fuerstiella marisgermanici]APZ94528.1 hypothetical protein Fuma_04160 [Fuerstiella marisgermanici]
MDPTTCYELILEYIESHDYSEARIYAAILHNWLAHRGFYPEGCVPERVDEVLEHLLKPACLPGAMRTRFRSITCYDCDNGSQIGSLKEAIDDGWTAIIGDDDLKVTSHLGTCPLCRMRDSQELLT